jgi:predicted nucleic acid-binding protein
MNRVAPRPTVSWSAGSRATLVLPSHALGLRGRQRALSQASRRHRQVLIALCDLGLSEVPLRSGLIQQTVALSTRHGITFFDAAYLAVAVEKGAMLLTTDGRFVRRRPSGFPVELLE